MCVISCPNRLEKGQGTCPLTAFMLLVAANPAATRRPERLRVHRARRRAQGSVAECVAPRLHLFSWPTLISWRAGEERWQGNGQSPEDSARKCRRGQRRHERVRVGGERRGDVRQWGQPQGQRGAGSQAPPPSSEGCVDAFRPFRHSNLYLILADPLLDHRSASAHACGIGRRRRVMSDERGRVWFARRQCDRPKKDDDNSVLFTRIGGCPPSRSAPGSCALARFSG